MARNTSFFLAPLESRHRQLLVIDMARSRNREWTARLVVKTDIVEKRKDPFYDDKFAFSMAAFDADVGIEFSINNYEIKSAAELSRWCGVYPVSLTLKDAFDGFTHPDELARYLQNSVFTLDRVAAFQNDMDNARARHYTGPAHTRGKHMRGKHRTFAMKRDHFTEMIKKHFGDDLDMEQLTLGGENTVCAETGKEEMK